MPKCKIYGLINLQASDVQKHIRKLEKYVSNRAALGSFSLLKTKRKSASHIPICAQYVSEGHINIDELWFGYIELER